MNKEAIAKTYELLEILQEDIQRTQDCLQKIQKLKTLVITRKDDELRNMLETIRSESGQGQEVKARRNEVREQLAVLFGCPVKDVTLGFLLAKFEGSLKKQIANTRNKLKAVTKELSVEHKSTTHLLCECTRFNRMLLDSIININSPETVTYDSSGKRNTSRDFSMMNLKF
jgi:hypothetical protein